jgi:hypothetical protein
LDLTLKFEIVNGFERHAIALAEEEGFITGHFLLHKVKDY